MRENQKRTSHSSSCDQKKQISLDKKKILGVLDQVEARKEEKKDWILKRVFWNTMQDEKKWPGRECLAEDLTWEKKENILTRPWNDSKDDLLTKELALMMKIIQTAIAKKTGVVEGSRWCYSSSKGWKSSKWPEGDDRMWPKKEITSWRKNGHCQLCIFFRSRDAKKDRQAGSHIFKADDCLKARERENSWLFRQS